MIRYYWGRFWPFLLFAFGVEAVENLFTVLFEYRNMDFGLLPLLKTAYVFVTEFAVTMCYWLIPYAVYLWILPRGKAGGKADRWLTSAWFFLFVLANLFEDVAEAFFWNEFEASFNFIAVDYLVYTKEVIGNIYESYPIIPILGGILAADIAGELGKPAFTVDPPVIDELTDVARLSGHRDFPRRPLFHALNARAVARRYAGERGLRYDGLRLIVAHMGGGVTVSAHRNGRIVDVNNGLEGEGPYSAERPGALPVLPIVKAVYEGKFGDSYESFRWFFTARCGLISYLGTNDGREVSLRARKDDREAELAYRGMAYQIAKEIGAMSAAMCGEVDAILLTGGFAHDDMFIGWIEEAVDFIAPVFIYSGENEMLALAQGSLRVLRGEEAALEYS